MHKLLARVKAFLQAFTKTVKGTEIYGCKIRNS